LTSNVSCFSNQPQAPHASTVKRILKYLKGTLDLCLTYSATTTPHHLTVYCNVEFAADFDDCKLRSSFVLLFNGATVALGSRKQQCIVLSTTESEYVAAHLVANEISWMCGLLYDLDYKQLLPTPLYCNNQTVICLVMNPVQPCSISKPSTST